MLDCVTVWVKRAGAGKTHITLMAWPQLVAAEAVNANTSNTEHEGMAIRVVVGKNEHGALKLSSKLDTAVANCPVLGMLLRVKPLAVHKAAALLKGTGSKKTTGS